MKMSKKFLQAACVPLSLTFAALVSGCSGALPAQNAAARASSGASAPSAAPAALGDVITFKYGHVDGTTSPKQIFAEKLNELLAEELKGKYQLEIYPNSQLGGERDLVEGVIMGTVDMTAPANTVAANFVDELNSVELPYLFEDYDHADKVFQGEIGEGFLEDINKNGMVGLAFFEAGFRQFSNNTRPIESIDDVAGLRLRVMENKMHQALWTALGADPVTMSWADAYTSIQQGAIDGIEVPLSITYSNNVQDVCKYLAITDHIYTATPVIMSQAAYGRIAPEDVEKFDELVRQAAAEALRYNRELCEQALDDLQQAGMTVTYPDIGPFQKAMEAVYAQYPQYADIIQEIKALV